MAGQLYNLLQIAEKFLAISDVEPALPILLGLMVENTDAERCRVELYDDGEILFAKTITAGDSVRDRDDDRISRKIIANVKDTKTVFVTPNAMRDPRLVSPEDRESTVVRQQLLSAACAPLLDGDEMFGVLYIDNRQEEAAFSDEAQALLPELADMLSEVANMLKAPLKKSLLHTMTQRRQQERFLALRKQVEELQGYGDLIGTSPAMQKVFKFIDFMKDFDKSSVLILGETGTGKELVARELHRRSARRAKEFVPFDCSAIPENMLESELFGHEQGAFTGANRRKKGLIEEAEGGTLFLDEIGNLSHTLQKKLLRFLQDKNYYRLGSTKLKKADVWLIFATNKNLSKMIESGEFMSDLYFRLTDRLPIELPLLCDRGEDILLIANIFLKKRNAEYALETSFSRQTRDCLIKYAYPGNIRELDRIVHHAVMLSSMDAKESIIQPHYLPEEVLSSVQYTGESQFNRTIRFSDDDFYAGYLPEAFQKQYFVEGQTASAEKRERALDEHLHIAVKKAVGMPLLKANDAVTDAFERNLLIALLTKTNGVIQDAAALAGIDRSTFSEKLKKHGLKREWYVE